MPNDVRDLFDALADDAGRAKLPPAAIVRRRSDRRLLTQSVASAAAVAVLIAGVAVGARVVLAGPDQQPMTPVAPAFPSSGPAVPPEAFLQPEDWQPGAAVIDKPESLLPLLPLCDKAWGVVHILGGTAALSYRDSTVAEDIYVYGRDGAERYLTGLREIVESCDTWRNGARYRVDGPIGLGEDSLLVVLEGGSTPTSYLAAVRHKDTIALLQITAAPGAPVTRQDAVDLARAATQRMAAWRR